MVVGGAVGGLGLIGAVHVVLEALQGRTPEGWASIMVVLLMMGGLQFVLLGVLGEYVGRALLTAGGKPQAVIRAVISRDERSATMDRS